MKAVEAEAARLGLPDRAWLDNALGSAREKWQNATQNLQSDDFFGWNDAQAIVRRQFSEAEKYASNLHDWYKNTLMSLISLHNSQTSRAVRRFSPLR